MANQDNTPINGQDIESDNFCIECREKWGDLCIEIEMIEDEIQSDISVDKPGSYIRTTHILRGRGADRKLEAHRNPDESWDLYIFLPKDEFRFLRDGYDFTNDRVIRNIYTKEEMEQRAKEFNEFMAEEEPKDTHSVNNSIEVPMLSLIQ